MEDGYIVKDHHFPSYNTYQGMPVEKYLKSMELQLFHKN